MARLALRGPSSRVAPWLFVLWLAFLGRVLGQLAVGLFEPDWLPPWEAWMSGALAYPYLLASQIAILALYLRIAVDFGRGRGTFVRPRAFFRSWLFGLGCLYLGGVLLRAGLAQLERFAWLADPIPIVFHVVLSSFLLLVALWHRGRV